MGLRTKALFYLLAVSRVSAENSATRHLSSSLAALILVGALSQRRREPNRQRW